MTLTRVEKACVNALSIIHPLDAVVRRIRVFQSIHRLLLYLVPRTTLTKTDPSNLMNQIPAMRPRNVGLQDPTFILSFLPSAPHLW